MVLTLNTPELDCHHDRQALTTLGCPGMFDSVGEKAGQGTKKGYEYVLELSTEASHHLGWYNQLASGLSMEITIIPLCRLPGLRLG